MDNGSHQKTDWDLEFLGPELEDLKGMDFDLSLTGFDVRELEELLADPDLLDKADLPITPFPGAATFGSVTTSATPTAFSAGFHQPGSRGAAEGIEGAEKEKPPGLNPAAEFRPRDASPVPIFPNSRLD